MRKLPTQDWLHARLAQGPHSGHYAALALLWVTLQAMYQARDCVAGALWYFEDLHPLPGFHAFQA
jgi:hypothetical protein